MMKEVKFFEVRDRLTFIPVMAVKSVREDDLNDDENYLLGRAGWTHGEILLIKLGPPIGKYSAYDWGNRTMETVHKHLQQKWFELDSGSVLDVQFILGETDHPKISERLDV